MYFGAILWHKLLWVDGHCALFVLLFWMWEEMKASAKIREMQQIWSCHIQFCIYAKSKMGCHKLLNCIGKSFFDAHYLSSSRLRMIWKGSFLQNFWWMKKGSVGCASNRQTQKFNVVTSSSNPMKSFCIFWKGGLSFSNLATGSNLQQVGILAIKVCFQKISKTHLLSDSKENRTNKTSVGT